MTTAELEEGKTELTEKAHKFLDMAKNLQVTTDGEYTAADNLNLDGKKQIKSVEKFFKPYIDTAHAAHKALTGDRNIYCQPIKDGCKLISDKLLYFKVQRQKRSRQEQIEREDKAREEEAIARKAEDERRLKEAVALDEQGKKEEADQVMNAPMQEIVNVPVVAVDPNPIPQGNTIFVDKWEYKVFDPALVPEEYKIIDQGALNKVAQASGGKQAMPGCKAVNKPYPKTLNT